MIPVLSKARKRELEDGSRYVGRPTIYGNPFKIGPDGTREEVIAKYRKYFYDRLETDPKFKEAVEKLRGAKSLTCWCAPLACHADVIAEYLETAYPGVI